jgi:hypothetical protein
MPDQINNDVTLGEIDRRLRDMRNDFSNKLGDMTTEIRSLRTELVRRDVYDANRITDQQRIYVVEGKVQDIEAERRLIRRLVYTAAFTAVSSAMVTVGAHFFNAVH